METFLTFSINNKLKIYWFPLDGIVKSLLNKDTDINSIKSKLPSLSQYFGDKTIKLLRKGVYPYDYMDENWENKSEEKKLPNIEYFHSSLSNTNFSIDDYNYAKEIYNFFGCKKIKDYNNLYVKTAVLLLADVHAIYRKNSHGSFDLDPLYCISTPRFSNREMLKTTNVEIKLINTLNHWKMNKMR